MRYLQVYDCRDGKTFQDKCSIGTLCVHETGELNFITENNKFADAFMPEFNEAVSKIQYVEELPFLKTPNFQLADWRED